MSLTPPRTLRIPDDKAMQVIRGLEGPLERHRTDLTTSQWTFEETTRPRRDRSEGRSA